MLLVKRKLNQGIAVGEAIDLERIAATADALVTVTRIVSSFDNPRTYGEIFYPSSGERETVCWTPSRPWVDVGGSVRIKVVDIKTVVYLPSGQVDAGNHRDGLEEPIVTWGVDAPRQTRIVRLSDQVAQENQEFTE